VIEGHGVQPPVTGLRRLLPGGGRGVPQRDVEGFPPLEKYASGADERGLALARTVRACLAARRAGP